MNKRITRSLLLATVIGSVGCGQAFKSQNSGSANNGAQSVSSGGGSTNTVSDQLTKAQAAAKDAQAALVMAQDAVAAMTDANGNINLGLFGKSGTASTATSGVFTALIAKLQPVFDKVYSKAQIVKQQFNSARGSLAALLAGLDKNDPVQAQQIASITSQLAQIDSLESQFQSSMQVLAGKIDLASGAIDKMVSGATASIPGFGWLAGIAIDYLVVGDVKNLMNDFKAKLLAL